MPPQYKPPACPGKRQSGNEEKLLLCLDIVLHRQPGTHDLDFRRNPSPAMDLDQLRTFLEIVRLKSFSKAAQTCFRTQPAISAQVRQLEQELNTSLFERLGTRIALTPAGRIFADFAEQILDLRKRAQ